MAQRQKINYVMHFSISSPHNQIRRSSSENQEKLKQWSSGFIPLYNKSTNYLYSATYSCMQYFYFSKSATFFSVCVYCVPLIILQCYQSANSVPVHTLPSFSLSQALTTGIKTFKEAIREICSQFDTPIVCVEPFLTAKSWTWIK